MKTDFAQNLAVVTVIHVVTVMCLVLITTLPGWRRHAPVLLPVQLIFGKPDGGGMQGQPSQSEAQRTAPPRPVADLSVPDSIPDPVQSIPRPPDRPAVRTVPRNVKVPPKVTNNNRVQRPAQQIRKPAAVSASDIARALQAGAGSRRGPAHLSVAGMGFGSGSGMADGDSSYLAVVKQAFYDSWNQPSYADVGDAKVVVTIRLVGNGTVTGHALKKSSGNGVMDASVMQAVQSVRSVGGLPSEFIRNHGDIEMVFNVEKEGPAL